MENSNTQESDANEIISRESQARAGEARAGDSIARQLDSNEPSRTPACLACYDLEHWPEIQQSLEGYHCWPNNGMSFVGFTVDWRQNMTSFILQRALKEILEAQQNCAKCRLLIVAIKSVEDGGLPDDTVVTVDAVENLPLRITYQLDCQPWQIELYQSTTPLEFKVEGDSPVPELSTEMFSPFIGKANDLKASMNAVEAAKLTMAWLSECVSAHEGCGGDESSVLPKRVIHVGSEDVNPRLIETIDGQRGRYVTLSYCWGRSISFITTTANFTTHLTGFSTSELPKTIEDAVRFCRHMKIDYLWADCICIIQDDLDDWREESSKMASIYQNSTLTLSATCAESVEKGCFSDEGRWFRRIVLQGQAGVFQLVVRMARMICHRCLFGDLASELRNSGREEDLAQRYPVLTRGWIFQERLLSRRTVHCARGDLFWECLVAKKCECTGDFFDPNERGDQLPGGVAVIGPKKKDHTSSSELLFRALMLGKALRNAKQLESSFTVTARPVQYRDHNGTVQFSGSITLPEMNLVNLAKNDLAERQPFHSWYDITIDYNAMWMALVEVYTSRRLTKATDKLVAFSGVAKVFEALLHFPLGEYYAGLWRAYLCLHLCWGMPQRLMPAVAMRTGEPSWSWSSIAEPCSYIIYLPTIFSERNLDEMEIFKVLEVETTPIGDNFGAISCGKIVGTGPVVDASIEFRHENDTNALAVGVRVEGSNQVFNVACDICQWKEESDEWAEMQSSDRLVEKETVICVGMLATVHSILSIIHQSTWLVCRKVDGNLKRIGIMTFGTFVPTLNNCFGHELAKYARDETCTLV